MAEEKPSFDIVITMGVELWNRFRDENPELSPSLQSANLEGFQLQGFNLQRANLTHANLRNADLRGAELQEAGLQEADLSGAKFRDANLQNANLTDAKGFRYGQLGGANLTGAKLPEAVGKFEALANVDELSQSAKKLFVTMLGACVYSWLTIATTTDARLIANSASSPLPIIQTPVPIVGFYVAAPLLILCLYLYFHFYMQRLWEGLADLPAFFPDGVPLDKKAHPWLLNGLVRSHFALLKRDRPALSRLQVKLASFLAWWVVPITLFFFWLRYLFRHDLLITVLQIALLAFSIGAAIWFSHLAAHTLAGEEKSPFIWKKAYRDPTTYKRAIWGVGLASALFLVSWVAVYGTNNRFLTYFADSFRADLADADVSTKPEGWTGREQDEEVQVALVKGARLSTRNLRGARASGAFLVKADLKRANLQGAVLAGANLQGADLQGANLQGADLSVADLQRADLRNAHLQGANLPFANLQGADLASANLQGASFVSANLQGADLQGADLRGDRGLTPFK